MPLCTELGGEDCYQMAVWVLRNDHGTKLRQLKTITRKTSGKAMGSAWWLSNPLERHGNGRCGKVFEVREGGIKREPGQKSFRSRRRSLRWDTGY